MGYITLSLGEVLQPEQGYVLEAASGLGIDITAVLHEAPTHTCIDKAELLGWPSHRVVKTIYVCVGEEMIGLVLPELDTRVDIRRTLRDLLHYSGNKAKRYGSSCLPDEMENGTCTPFVPERILAGEATQDGKTLRCILTHTIPDIVDEVVDISVGGLGDKAHRMSLQLPYRAIFDILKYTRLDIVQMVYLFLQKDF